MAVIINDKLLFIHVPKTGGSFIRSVFKDRSRGGHFHSMESGEFKVEDHFGIRETKLHHPELCHLYSFGFIRNPVEWIKSRWAWAMESGFEQKMQVNEDAAQHWMAEVWSNDFKTFVENYIIIGQPRAEQTMFGLLGLAPDGTFTMNSISKICKYENLIHEIQFVCHLNDITLPISTILETHPRRVAAKGKYKDQVQLPLSLSIEIYSLEKKLSHLYYQDEKINCQNEYEKENQTAVRLEV